MTADKNEKKGRNIGFVNPVIFEILENALPHRYLSMGELAEGIHHHYEGTGKKNQPSINK